MDRGALLLYLRNVRDLEVARYRIIVQYNREMRSVEKKKRELETAHHESEPNEITDFEVGSLIMGIIFLGVGILGVVATIGCWIDGKMTIWYWIGLIFWLLAILIGFSCASVQISSHKEYKEKCDNVKKHNEAEQARVLNNKPAVARLTTDWKNKEKWYNGEYSKVQQLLADFYGMNILPSQYRTLAAVCYIYDYMSTSQASLEDTLIHEHMENGIQRLEAKLDSIIVRLEDIVYETRCLRQNSERTIEQNNNMLSSLRQTEQNTLEAAQYAQLSANYSRANAYFSLATYLKD